jgi:hypothetical protein
MPESTVVTLHGIELAVPAGWEDWTLFRFKAPPRADLGTPLHMRAAQAPSKPAFRSNLMVTKYELREPATIEHIFDAPNLDALRHQREFKVLRAGLGTYRGTAMAWQDTTFFEPAVQAQIFQRQIALLQDPAVLVVLSLTSDTTDLDALARQIGLPTGNTTPGGLSPT